MNNQDSSQCPSGGKLAVGHFYNEDFIHACSPWRERIGEVFFAWPGVLSCRPAPDFTPELRERLVADLSWARQNGLLLDTLFNCNCYGEQAVSQELADLVRHVIMEMDKNGLFPDIVTTTSPFIATILKRIFPSIKVRASVNMRAHGTIGFESVADIFDEFYLSREHHRDLAWLARLGEWSRAHGKVLGMQANSGCLRQCPFQQFHDNLHGHNRMGQSKVGEQFGFSVFRCKTNYDRGNYEDFLRATWIRPEDLPRYEEHVDVVKLATRRHAHPVEVLNAYATYSYEGDLALLMDPSYPFPKSFDNAALGASPLWQEVRACPDVNDCRHCGRCTELLREVFRPRVAGEPAGAHVASAFTHFYKG